MGNEVLCFLDYYYYFFWLIPVEDITEEICFYIPVSEGEESTRSQSE